MPKARLSAKLMTFIYPETVLNPIFYFPSSFPTNLASLILSFFTYVSDHPFSLWNLDLAIEWSASPPWYLFTTLMHREENSSVFIHSQPRTPTVTFHKWKNHRSRRLIVKNRSFWRNANSWIKFVRGYQSWSNLIFSLINLCTLLKFKLRKFWFKTKFKGVIKTKTDFNFCTGWCTPAEFTTVSLLHINFFWQIYIYLWRQCQVS